MSSPPRVLIIDDDTELCELVSEFLEQEGFTVEAVHDGPQGVARALAPGYALIVLDVMLPGLGGFEVLKQIRARSDVPVVMLTARGEEVDRIVGLEIGADDYLPKPFNPRELAARMRAILRRAEGTSANGRERAPETITVGDVEVDPGARLVWRAGDSVRMTGIEFTILEILVRSSGRVVSREELYRSALDRRPSPFDRSLDVHISNLRRKLGPQSDGLERIKTVRGVGYLYARPAGRGPA